jgi:predicted DNA-binding transcriptional regulator AlpA
VKDIRNFDSLPDSAMVRASQLVGNGSSGGILPFGSTTLWRHVKEGKFPKPQKISTRVTAWKVGDVRAWQAQREGKATP